MYMIDYFFINVRITVERGNGLSWWYHRYLEMKFLVHYTMELLVDIWEKTKL